MERRGRGKGRERRGEDERANWYPYMLPLQRIIHELQVGLVDAQYANIGKEPRHGALHCPSAAPLLLTAVGVPIGQQRRCQQFDSTAPLARQDRGVVGRLHLDVQEWIPAARRRSKANHRHLPRVLRRNLPPHHLRHAFRQRSVHSNRALFQHCTRARPTLCARSSENRPGALVVRVGEAASSFWRLRGLLEQHLLKRGALCGGWGGGPGGQAGRRSAHTGRSSSLARSKSATATPPSSVTMPWTITMVPTYDGDGWTLALSPALG